MDKIVGVYCILNSLNMKRYVGSSIDVKHRINEHKRTLILNIHKSRYLQRAWNKYGESNFSFYVLESVKINQRIEREQFYMDLFKSSNRKYGYNLVPLAFSSLGYKYSEEDKKRRSENHHMRKITKQLVKQIRLDRETSHTELAPKLGLTVSQIHNIRAGKCWKYTYPELIWTKAEMKKHKLFQWVINQRKISIFNYDDIRDIRLNHKDTNIKLGKSYGVSDVQISYIRYGKSWADVYPELIWSR